MLTPHKYKLRTLFTSNTNLTLEHTAVSGATIGRDTTDMNLKESSTAKALPLTIKDDQI